MSKSALQYPRHQYDFDADAVERDNTDINFEGTESMTIQDAPGTDLNDIMRMYGVTDGSILPGQHLGIFDPSYYGDFTESPADLRDALDRTREAEERFGQLPAGIRARFQNNPWQLWEWVTRPENHKEAVQIGLLKEMAPEPILEPKKDEPKPEA